MNYFLEDGKAVGIGAVCLKTSRAKLGLKGSLTAAFEGYSYAA
jgi:hypothetical protein